MTDSMLAMILALAGASVVVVSAILLFGALVPRTPYLGAVGSIVWPTLIGPATVVATIALMLEVAALLIDDNSVARVFIVIGGLVLVGSLVILGSQVVAARRAGVPIRPKVLVAVGLGPKEPADESVIYATGPDRAPLRLDLYRSERLAENDRLPIIVYVHGGGWFQGAPDENSAILRWFADQGYLVAAPEYTLATDERATWDIATPQIARALIWVAEHAEAYGADPERIAVWGASAGANLSLIAAYAGASGQLELPDGSGVPRVSAVAGEVPAVDPRWINFNTDPIWGPKTREMVTRYIGGNVEDHPDRLAAIRAETYLSPHAPPTLLTVSAGDHLVPVEGVRRFVDAARAAGVEVRAEYRRWGDHVIAAIYDGLSCQTMMRLMLEHFRNNGV